MQEKFIDFLISQGHPAKTTSGHPSTAFGYPKRINKACEWENTTWEGLAHNISSIIAMYDKGGIKEECGNQSHGAVISTLKRFSDFLSEQ